MTDSTPSPFSIPNVKRFIYFRIFFNARFYYPIFTILFLDFGLTLSQFAILNVVWAATIVLFEVPSGALADVVGRRNLVVAAAVLMVFELLFLVLAPQGIPSLLFTFFVINRILSGLAEAAASGADEALAYDSLQARGMEDCWGQVLAVQMRAQSCAFILAMSIGAMVYDPELINSVFSWLGYQTTVNQDDTLRIPIYLTLVMAFLALYTTLGMREVATAHVSQDPNTTGSNTVGSSKPDSNAGNDNSFTASDNKTTVTEKAKPKIFEAFLLTIQAGRWILTTPLALCLILSGLMFDHVIRMILTLNSQYYRMIDLPEASFGLIGAGMSVVGLFVPAMARIASERCSLLASFLLMCLLCFLSLSGMALLVPYWGLAPALLIVVVMMMNNFLLSHHLHKITDSHQRATVLSFRGLSFNLAYGTLGLLYAALIAGLEKSESLSTLALDEAATADWTFAQSLLWFPGYFLIFALFLSLFAFYNLKSEGRQKITAKPNAKRGI
jgi:MFS family permease